MRDVVWGDLDILLIDLPPPAGQPQQELLDQRLLDAVLLVTTPPDMSLLDAGRIPVAFDDLAAAVWPMLAGFAASATIPAPGYPQRG